MTRTLSPLLFLLAAFLFPVTAGAQLSILDGTPAGFEHLDTPRPTAVTVSYGGETLGVFPAHFTPGRLRFDQPQAFASLIPGLIKPAPVIRALSDYLPGNAALLCSPKRPDHCGTLTPKVAGVIFDEEHLRAELFVHSSYLSLVDTSGERYLPLPERKISSVASFSGAVNGQGSEKPSYTLGNDTIFSLGEGSVDAQTSLSDQGLRFDRMTAGVERRGWSGQGGLLRSEPLQLLSDRDIAGVSLSTSRRTRTEAKKTEGNDVILFLPRRAFVSLYREGRLYASRAYDAGNQRIDTSDLPNGAYTLTLRIQEPDGTTREERRFYAKMEEIPPPGQPSYYAQAGVIRQPAGLDNTLPRLTGDPLVRVGTLRRLGDAAGLDVGVMGVRDRAIAEASAFWVTPDVQFRATALGSTEGDVGAQASFLKNLGRLSASFDARKLLLARSPIPGYEDIPGGYTQMSGSLAYAASSELTFGARLSYAAQSGSPLSLSAGPYVQWRLWQRGESIVTLDADGARTEDRNQGSILAHFSYRMGRYGVSGTAGSEFGAQGGPTADMHLWRDDQTPGNSLLTNAGVTADRNHRSLNLDSDWHNRVGEFRGSVDQSFGVNSGLGYGGNFALGAAQTGQDLEVGGDQNDKSAVVVTIDGDAETEMNLYVNNMLRTTVKPNARQVVYLTPFHSYTVRVAPKTSGLYDYDSQEKTVTLYPGNVAKLNWHVNRFYVLVAHLMRPEGTPLVNASLLSSHDPIETDARGQIQAEIHFVSALELRMPGNGVCRAALPPIIPVNGVLLYRRPLVCRPF